MTFISNVAGIFQSWTKFSNQEGNQWIESNLEGGELYRSDEKWYSWLDEVMNDHGESESYPKVKEDVAAQEK